MLRSMIGGMEMVLDKLELYHSGVLGMRWGVRNDETRARYLREKRAYKDSRKKERLERRKEKHSKTLKSAYRHRKEFTAKELDDLVKRFDTEKKLKDLVDYDNKNKKTLNEKINNAIDTGEKAYNLYKKIADDETSDYGYKLSDLTVRKLDKMTLDELQYLDKKTNSMANITKSQNPMSDAIQAKQKASESSIRNRLKSKVKDSNGKQKTKPSKNNKENSNEGSSKFKKTYDTKGRLVRVSGKIKVNN